MKIIAFAFSFVFVLSSMAFAHTSPSLYVMEIEASSREERSQLAEIGLSIEKVESQSVTAIGRTEDLETVKKMGKLLASWPIHGHRILNFPVEDEKFHDYQEFKAELEQLKKDFPQYVHIEKIGESHEGRDLLVITLTNNIEKAEQRPAVFFVGGHHAREHVSVEIPLQLIRHFVESYTRPEAHLRADLEHRTIYIMPMLNPDGSEFDIATGDYRYWRKNRRINGNGSFGVDLNRNYPYMWGTGGASPDPESITYRGPSPLSEPETQALARFVKSHNNISILLSFHTFSELILYPWGYTYDHIGNERDHLVHKTMAEKMATWNNYSPEQSSDLYISSGDTTDWSYGELGIFSFTFELDPRSMWDGGFYPGQDMIETIFQKNIRPCYYLLEYADNPYRVLEPVHVRYGLSSPLIQ